MGNPTFVEEPMLSTGLHFASESTVAAEWAVVCIAHNVLKLAQGWTPFIADAAAA
jgi:hypothetical protein